MSDISMVSLTWSKLGNNLRFNLSKEFVMIDNFWRTVKFFVKKRDFQSFAAVWSIIFTLEKLILLRKLFMLG